VGRSRLRKRTGRRCRGHDRRTRWSSSGRPTAELRLERGFWQQPRPYAGGDRLGTAEAYRFVSDHPARYPVATMCRVLSGLSQRVLRRARPLAPETGPRRHGAQGTDRADPRRGSGERNPVGRKRVARLMREGGWRGKSATRTTGGRVRLGNRGREAAIGPSMGSVTTATTPCVRPSSPRRSASCWAR